MKLYIDFDGTLFNSTKQYQLYTEVFKKYNIEKDYIDNILKKSKSFDVVLEKVIKEKNLNNSIYKDIDNIYSNNLIYEDVIPFLEKYSNKYDLILLTLGDIIYQEKKIKYSNISKYFKEIIITDKDKSKLDIDYSNGLFIDNNPKELKKFYNSNAKYLIRIKRDNDKYSIIDLNIDNIKEFKDFNELIESNYIEKIGE